MSPAAVDHGGNSTNNSRRNSLGYSPRDKFSDPKSPKSPDCASSLLQKNLLRFPQTFSPLISFRTTTICGGVVVDNNNLNLHHTPPKRTRPSSLYSPPPTTTTTPKFFKPEFVRNFNSSEWFGCNDQNSRDSGFESAASTSSSSHRSTPVDQTDTDVITNGGVESSSAAILSSVKRQCRWDDCPNPDLDEGDELLEHILSAHVQPLESSTETCRSSSKNNTNLEKYSCRWKDCKVYCKPSRLYAWLERHVVEKHAGPRPYGCPVPGCRQRFNGRSAAERHINSHFENSADDETAAAATATSVPVMTVNARTTTTTTRRNNNKNLHETKRKTTPIKTTDDKIYDVQKCCLLSPRKSFNTTTTTTTTSTVNGGKKKNCINIIPISSSSARLSNDDVVGEPENAACATKILASTVTSSTTTVNKKRCHASSKSSKLYCSMFLMFFVICRKTLFSLSFYVYFFFVSSAALFFFILQ